MSIRTSTKAEIRCHPFSLDSGQQPAKTGKKITPLTQRAKSSNVSCSLPGESQTVDSEQKRTPRLARCCTKKAGRKTGKNFTGRKPVILGRSSGNGRFEHRGSGAPGEGR
jgi:hypothetical protein